MTYVKQNDHWHVVDPKGERDPKERRPHLRAVCGRKLHTGQYDEPIDDKPIVCGSKEHRAECEALAAQLEKDLKANRATLPPEQLAVFEASLAQLRTFCTGDS